jgi:ankyrin repeat protein
MWAAMNGHRECVGALLAAGARIDAEDAGGMTAQKYAAGAERSECWLALEAAREARALEASVGKATHGARKAAL